MMFFHQLITTLLRTSIVTLSEPSGYIESPYYPLPYPGNADVTWLIELPNPNAKVLIHFEKLNLRSTSTSTTACNLTIHDGPTSAGTVLVRYTQSNYTSVRDWQSSGGSVFVQFRSNANQGAADSGFRMHYSSVTSHRNLSLTENATIIETPNYPNNYLNSEQIQWAITMPEANFSRLEILDFETEEEKDYLQIRKGSTINDEVVTTLSGNVGSYSLINSVPNLFLRFFSDDENTKRGFKAVLIKGHRYNVTGDEEEISSANYPEQYNNWTTEYWLLTNTFANGKLLLEFEDFETEEGHDIVTVRDGNNDTSPILGSFSGSELPHTLLSSGRTLFVTFLADGENSKKGFKAKFTAVHQDYTTTHAPICTRPGVYRIPFPGFCEKCYLCVNFVEYEETCAPGLWFDPILQVCNLESEVDCPWAPTSTTELVTEPEVTTEESVCPPSGIVYLPIPGECDSYILCAEGTPIYQRCPEGTLFDPVELRCRLAEEVECLKKMF